LLSGVLDDGQGIEKPAGITFLAAHHEWTTSRIVHEL
jgi:hypothetical protein